MAKRFTATEIWSEDWFLDMPNEYKLFWYYMLSNCNHAGLFKVNLRSFCGQLEVKVGSKEALNLFNAGKQRIREVTPSIWLIEDFFVYQYGAALNTNNRVHASIVKEYDKHGIKLTSIRGLIDLKDRVKDKDKDIIVNKVSSRDTGIVVEMARIFKEINPVYQISKDHYPHCLQIAYRIAEMKKWKKEEVLNGKMDETLKSWKKIAEFISTDEWLSTRGLIDLNTTKEWDRLIQKMNLAKNPIKPKEPNSSPIKKESDVDFDKYKTKK